jgi:hypothetical protein
MRHAATSIAFTPVWPGNSSIAKQLKITSTSNWRSSSSPPGQLHEVERPLAASQAASVRKVTPKALRSRRLTDWGC